MVGRHCFHLKQHAFFRSEERVHEWCAGHGYPMRPLVTMDQLWTLATTWYSTRLQQNSRRPQPDEMRFIFASLGCPITSSVNLQQASSLALASTTSSTCRPISADSRVLFDWHGLGHVFVDLCSSPMLFSRATIRLYPHLREGSRARVTQLFIDVCTRE